MAISIADLHRIEALERQVEAQARQIEKLTGIVEGFGVEIMRRRGGRPRKDGVENGQIERRY